MASDTAATTAPAPTEGVAAADKPVKPAAGGWLQIAGGAVGALACLYLFLVGLQLMGDSFKCLGGKGAGAMFSAVDNPIAGLMTGVLGTVMVQSSSTSTSIVVGLVGADQITPKNAIPMIMGANIGTSVTNTIVSLGQSTDRVMLQRAFAGATVHDMFNLLTVATLLPMELIIGAIEGHGGPLYWLSDAVAGALMGGGQGSNPLKGASPTKIITSPVAKLVISNNKYIINALSLGAPTSQTPTEVNGTACQPPAARRLLSRRLTGGGEDCSQYFCVSEQLDTNFKKISKTAYAEQLTKCGGLIVAPADPCGASEKCYLDAGAYFKANVEERPIIKGGFTQGAGDVGGGVISLLLALAILTGGLFGLCKLLQMLFLGRAKSLIRRSTRFNDYAAMCVGICLTILVQSSSVTTSALTPLCGLGLIPLAKMLPLTLGANIGTTVTALLASLAVFTRGAVQIAMCHLFFNIIGILIWFPAPPMRRVPLGAASLLGLYAAFYRAVPVVYLLVVFVLVPLLALAVCAALGASVAGGVVLLLVLLLALAAFEFWWWRQGCYRVLSEEQRSEGKLTLERANAELAAANDAADAEAPAAAVA